MSFLARKIWRGPIWKWNPICPTLPITLGLTPDFILISGVLNIIMMNLLYLDYKYQYHTPSHAISLLRVEFTYLFYSLSISFYYYIMYFIVVRPWLITPSLYERVNVRWAINDHQIIHNYYLYKTGLIFPKVCLFHIYV